MNVYFIDEAPRTLSMLDQDRASFNTLKKGLETIGYGLIPLSGFWSLTAISIITVKLKNCPPSSVLQSIFIRRNMEGFGRSSTPWLFEVNLNEKWSSGSLGQRSDSIYRICPEHGGSSGRGFFPKRRDAISFKSMTWKPFSSLVTVPV